jgi:hypothetical protein
MEASGRGAVKRGWLAWSGCGPDRETGGLLIHATLAGHEPGDRGQVSASTRDGESPAAGVARQHDARFGRKRGAMPSIAAIVAAAQ